MIKPASSLAATVKITRQQEIEFFEDYLMSLIEKYSADGKKEIVLSAYNISVNPSTGDIQRGLHSRDSVAEFVWQWKNIRDYPEIIQDFENNGYRIYQKNYSTSIWCEWGCC